MNRAELGGTKSTSSSNWTMVFLCVISSDVGLLISEMGSFLILLQIFGNIRHNSLKDFSHSVLLNQRQNLKIMNQVLKFAGSRAA
jgi:hypothetical protein